MKILLMAPKILFLSSVIAVALTMMFLNSIGVVRSRKAVHCARFRMDRA